MATRWSRLHGEFYLRRGRGFGEVEDVEELTVVLWFGGIGQWRSVLGDLARGGHGFPVTALAWKRMAERKWRDEERVSEVLAFIWEHNARCGGANRACTPRGGQPLNWSATAFSEDFLKRLNRSPVARLTA